MHVRHTVLVTGGAGYVGSVLVPKLLAAGHAVRVIDTYWFGDHVHAAVKHNPKLTGIKADIRDRTALDYALTGCTAVIHLASISDEPSFEMDVTLGKSINYGAILPLVELAKKHGVRRFINTSSSSVYGINDDENATEELELKPRTAFAKFKELCEDVLQDAREPGFTVLTIRPATVCGYSPRLRLDLDVNILTNLAVNKREIAVIGGSQLRTSLHIQDMTDLYCQALQWPADKIDGKVFNAGGQNLTITEIAAIVKAEVGADVKIVRTRADDPPSCRVSSAKIKRELGWEPRYSVQDSVRELVAAFKAGKLPDSLTDPRYFNMKTMNAHLAAKMKAA